MFKSKPKMAVKPEQPKNSEKKPRSKTYTHSKEDLTLQMKNMKISEEPNLENLMRNMPSIKKKSKYELTSPKTAKLCSLDRIEMEEEIPNKILGNDEIYDLLYGNIYEKQLYDSEPDLNFMLKNHQIRDILRAKMVDWMIEVFANYNETSSSATFFKAIAVMDLYYKKCKKVLKDNDVHLAGIASMFIASKYEDIYHIPMQDFLDRVAHNKFTSFEIKAKEWEIISTLNFDVCFPTSFTFFKRFFWKSFNWKDSNSQYAKSLENTGCFILEMLLYNSNLMKYRMHIIGLTALILGLNSLFNELISVNRSHKEVLKKNVQEIKLGIMSLNQQIDKQELEKCIIEAGSFVTSFETIYPGYINYSKYQLDKEFRL